jgi:hypothetical protein
MRANGDAMPALKNRRCNKILFTARAPDVHDWTQTGHQLARRA